MQQLDPLDYFVGLIMQRDRFNRRLFISQPTYIGNIISTYNMANCKKRKIPADPGNKLIKRVKSTSDESERERTPAFPYREAVGSLMYAASTFRPDIAFAVGQVSQHSNDPDKSHCEAVKRIIAYLAGTPQHGIQLGSKERSTEGLVGFDGQSAGQLNGFVDSDYAGNINTSALPLDTYSALKKDLFPGEADSRRTSPSPRRKLNMWPHQKQPGRQYGLVD